MIRIHEITTGYIEAALWADCERMCECEPKTDACDCLARMESGGMNGVLIVRVEDYAYCYALCEAFVRAAGMRDLETFATAREVSGGYSPWACVGHDLRLTSSGHGTGFWDRQPKPSQLNCDVRWARFAKITAKLTAIAESSAFDRSFGGDIWQTSETMAAMDHIPFLPGGEPGARWECPDLTSDQRQAWIEEGLVPTLAEMAQVRP